MEKSKCLLLFMGECFREAMPTGRLRDTEYGFKNQKESSLSHKDLYERLESLGYDVDVAIHTYPTKYENELKSWYSNIRYFHTVDTDLGCFKNAVHVAIQNTFKVLNLTDYDFVFICRLDLLLKPKLIAMFDPSWTRIMYPNVMNMLGMREIEKHNIGNVKIPNISDVFCFIPRRFYRTCANGWPGILAASDGILYHNACIDMHKHGMSMDEIGFVSNRLYIANTHQQKNPLYAINCRPEGTARDFNTLRLVPYNIAHYYDSEKRAIVKL